MPLSALIRLATMNPPALKRIFHPADFTKGDEGAYAHALRLAFAAGANLSLLHVGGADSDNEWDDFPSVRELLSRWAFLGPNAHRTDVTKLGLRVEKVHRRGPDPLDAILSYLDDHQTDLIVVSTHQRSGLDRWMHQARAEALAHASNAMTLFVPRRISGFVSVDTGKVRLETILIPIDHTPRPQAALDAAVHLAETLACPMVRFIALHVGREEDIPEVRLPERDGWTLETQAWNGPVVDHILGSAEANDAGLIVMATSGRHGPLDALRGSTTERVVRGTKCPVLAVVAPAG